MYDDTDGDGVYDNLDLDDDNDGILDTEESSCEQGSQEEFNYLDFWAIDEDPVVDAPISPVTLGDVSLSIHRIDATGDVQEGVVSNLNTENGIYKVTQNSRDDGLSIHEFIFSEPVNNLEFEVFDIDSNVNFKDQIVINAYEGLNLYDLQVEDIVAQGSVVSFDGNNTFHGTALTSLYPEGQVRVTFPVPVNRIAVEFTTIGDINFNTQTIGFKYGITFCEDTDSDNDGVPNSVDLDSDNDGIYDAVEAGSGEDSTDGMLDGDVDGFGIPNSVSDGSGGVTYEVVNTDETDTPNFIDSDSDNDGCFDTTDALFTDAADDADYDGILGENPVTTDEWGVVTSGTDGYTTPDGGYVDDEIDGCFIDEDGDGVEAGDDIDDNDPCVPNIFAFPNGDCDGDGLTNVEEDPNMDGIVDDGESDPTDACDPNVYAIPEGDCDNDGISNADEDTNGNGMYDEGLETDANNPDTDGDGYTDGEEVNDLESDPLNPCDPDVYALADGDCDNDGLTNADEDTNGNGMYDEGLETDANNPDTDGDGYTDGEEVNDLDSDPLNPCDPDPLALDTNDCDNDGLTNAEEAVEGTDPLVADTDGDGINDGDEVNDTDSDPLNPCDPDVYAVADGDCDNDGITNADEDTNGNGMYDEGLETDANNPDTDGDGYLDGEETTGTDNEDSEVIPEGISDALDPCDPDPLALESNDCDNDGLDNGQEDEQGTDPLVADTDGDGIMMVTR